MLAQVAPPENIGPVHLHDSSPMCQCMLPLKGARFSDIFLPLGSLTFVAAACEFCFHQSKRRGEQRQLFRR